MTVAVILKKKAISRAKARRIVKQAHGAGLTAWSAFSAWDENEDGMNFAEVYAVLSSLNNSGLGNFTLGGILNLLQGGDAFEYHHVLYGIYPQDNMENVELSFHDRALEERIRNLPVNLARSKGD